jgi:transposase InsO family protein
MPVREGQPQLTVTCQGARAHLYRATIGDGNALAVEVNLFHHTYNTLRPHQALDERTPRAANLAVEHCD